VTKSIKCPFCERASSNTSAGSTALSPINDRSSKSAVRRWGKYWRECDGVHLPRFRCMKCHRTFSRATDCIYRGTKRRDLAKVMVREACSAKSLRRIASDSRAAFSTVLRHFDLAAQWCARENRLIRHHRMKTGEFYFDEMGTSIQSYLKPTWIGMLLSGDREILDFDLAAAPATGRLAAKARRAGIVRPNQRREMRAGILRRLSESSTLKPEVIITDLWKSYANQIRKICPGVPHLQFKAKKPRRNSKRELRSGGFDELFPLNHTATKMRHEIARLGRQTWCTSKTMEGLRRHLEIFMYYHNEVYLPQFRARRERQRARRESLK